MFGSAQQLHHEARLALTASRSSAAMRRNPISSAWLPTQGAAQARVRCRVNAGERVALTCFEREPEPRNRHRADEALSDARDEVPVAARGKLLPSTVRALRSPHANPYRWRRLEGSAFFYPRS